ncbi:head-tail connector protein [Clostridium butyricum]|uniref:head-tail connector protein n=1 Tax=Clostridium butyricum TaxID=1492 RepID=UPI000903AB51|nr:head-tail connector protein [Clostridium butyricum]APF24011.1 phage gp6-like head-tail connector family protein [Clostridium butyricum]
MLEKIKLSLRIDSDDLDEEIRDAIDSCKADLKLSGVLESKIVDGDSLILRAVKVFCKSEFSTDDREAERYRKSFQMLKDHLCLSVEYTVEVFNED